MSVLLVDARAPASPGAGDAPALRQARDGDATAMVGAGAAGGAREEEGEGGDDAALAGKPHGGACCTPVAPILWCGAAADGSGCAAHSYCGAGGACVCCPLWGPSRAEARPPAPRANASVGVGAATCAALCDESIAARCPTCWSVAYGTMAVAYAAEALFALSVTCARLYIIKVKRGYGVSGGVGGGGGADGSQRRQRLLQQRLTFKDVALSIVAVCTGMLAVHCAEVRWFFGPDDVTLGGIQDTFARLGDALFVAGYAAVLLSTVSMVESINSSPQQARCARIVLGTMLFVIPPAVVIFELIDVPAARRIELYAYGMLIAAVIAIPVGLCYIRRLHNVVVKVAQFGRWQQERVDSGLTYLRNASCGAIVIGLSVAVLTATMTVFGFSMSEHPSAFYISFVALHVLEMAAPLHIAYVSVQWDPSWLPCLRFLGCRLCRHGRSSFTERRPLTGKGSTVEVSDSGALHGRNDSYARDAHGIGRLPFLSDSEHSGDESTSSILGAGL